MNVDLDRSRLGWLLVGLALAATLLFVLYSFIGTFVFGVFIYHATRPVYRRLRTRVYPRSLAAALSILLLTLPALLLGAYTLAIGLNELERLLQNREGLDALQAFLAPYFDVSAAFQDPTTLLGNPDVLSFLRQSFDSALAYAGFIGNALLHLFVMLAIAFYLLRDGPRLSRWALRSFGDERGVLDRYTSAVDEDFSSIFFGNILNAIITSIIGATCYSVLNFALGGPDIPYPFLLGLLTGVGSLVPVVGMKLVYVPVAVYLGLVGASSGEGITFLVAFVVVSFFIVDLLPDFVLRPYVSGRNLHVGSVMFAYIFGPLLFGWYGIFLGPVALVLTVHFAKLVLPELIAREPIRPYAVDPSVETVPPPSVDAAVETTPDGGPESESESEGPGSEARGTGTGPGTGAEGAGEGAPTE